MTTMVGLWGECYSPHINEYQLKFQETERKKLKSLKSFFNSLVHVFVVIVLFSGCGRQYDHEENPNGSRIVTTNIISHCAKEKSEENRIFFNYPQFEGTYDDIHKMNDLISKFISSALKELCDGGFNGNLNDVPEIWEWDNNEYTLQAMDIAYNIVRNDSNYFSVVFEGLYNFKAAAHPLHYFNSLVIDVKKKEVIFLWDMYDMNGGFEATVYNALQEKMQNYGISDDPDDIFRSELDRAIHAFFQAAAEGKENFDRKFYLTDSAVGIYFATAFEIVDHHLEFLISYEDLQQYRK